MNSSQREEIDIPSNLFFIINYSSAIVISIIGITLCLTLLITVILHRKCHTISNLLACNTSIGIICYLVLAIHASIYGLREDWAWNSPLCIPRAYLFIVTLGIVCYSFAIQSLSRLVFTIYYQYRFLLSWRLHRVMIGVNWLISFLIPIVPLSIDGSLGLDKISRCCVLKTKAFSASVFCMITVIGIPMIVTTIVYRQLYYYSRRSTNRILRSSRCMNTRRVRLNVRRDLKLVQQLLIHTSCSSCGGTIFVFNVFWQEFSGIPLPKSMFLLGYILMTLGIGMISIAHFMLNKKVKRIVLRQLFK